MANHLHRYKDITGERRGKLTAVAYSSSYQRYKPIWVFKCDCGNSIHYRADAFLRGVKLHCGCEKTTSTAKRPGTYSTTRQRGRPDGRRLFDESGTPCTLVQIAEWTATPLGTVKVRAAAGWTFQQLMAASRKQPSAQAQATPAPLAQPKPATARPDPLPGSSEPWVAPILRGRDPNLPLSDDELDELMRQEAEHRAASKPPAPQSSPEPLEDFDF